MKIQKFTITFLIVLLIGVRSHAQYTSNSFPLQINGHEYFYPESIQQFDAMWDPSYLNQFGFDGRFYAYMQFEILPTSDIRKQMENSGIHFLSYLPENTYIVSFVPGISSQLLSYFHVRGVYPIAGEQKTASNLFNVSPPVWCINNDETVNLIATYYSDMVSADVESAFEKFNISVVETQRDGGYHSLVIRIPIDRINAVASLPFIAWLEPVAPPSEPENYESRTDHRNNILASDFISGMHYTGNNVWLALEDDGQIGPHIDYQGRLDQTNASASAGNHGDHCAGILGGAGNVDPKGKGNGFGCNIILYDASGWESLYAIPTSVVNPGVVITSTSYSDGCNAGYSTVSQMLDQQIWDYPFLMHVFSAGNQGGVNCGPLTGWYEVTGGHKVAKNCITVANVTKEDFIATSSSRGPSEDGRLKPEISSVGTNVYSTMDPNTYQVLTGTSMSCPGVAGTLTQLYEGWKDLHGGSNPQSDIIKSSVLVTADDLGNPGPDYTFGYGRINARRAWDLLSTNHFFTDSIDQGQNKNINLSIPAGTSQVRVMLYWNDYPADPAATTDLVNNLDLTITDPTSNLVLPWVLDPTPNNTALNSNAVHGTDNLNNSELITIDNPLAGNYVIHIAGTTVPFGAQHFVVAYEMLHDQIVVTYPFGGEHWVPGETERIRWDSYGNSGIFTVDLSTDGGTTWATTNTVNAAFRYADITVPSIVSGNCLVRVSRGSISDVSDTLFSIIPVPANFHVTQVCPNSITLKWDTVAGANEYTIYKLGAKYMDPMGVSTVDSFTITPINGLGDYWFAVSANNTNAGAKGRRCIAIEHQGLTNCVITDDVSAFQIDSPAFNIMSNCLSSSATTVSVSFFNNGLNVINTANLSFNVDGLNSVTETWNGTLLPGDTTSYTFTATANFSVAGSHQLQVIITFANDQNPFNDSLNKTIIITPTASLNLYENFETDPLCNTGSDCEQTTCNLQNNWINLVNLSDDDIDWRTNEGPTPSVNTGPDVDYEPGTASGNYVYLEASNLCFFKTALLQSPCIDLSNTVDPKLDFAYHMYGVDMGELHVDLYDNGTLIQDITPMQSGDHGNQWLTQSVSLAPYIGHQIIVRFRGITGANTKSDLALDAIKIYDANFQAGFSVSSTSLCVGDTITFFNSSIGNISNYLWNFGSGSNPSTDTTSGPVQVVYNTAGTKSVSLTITGAVGTDSQTQSFNINSVPVASFNIFPTQLSVQTINNSTNATSYSWDFGNGTTSTQTEPVVVYSAAGNFTITLIASNECGSDTATQTFDVATGIENNFSNQHLMIFPNPTSGIVNIKGSVGSNSMVTLMLQDVNGKLLMVNTSSVSKNWLDTSLDLSSVSSGIYFLRIIQNGNSNWYKIVR